MRGHRREDPVGDTTIDEMMGGGLITLEKANVIIYRPQDKR